MTPRLAFVALFVSSCSNPRSTIAPVVTEAPVDAAVVASWASSAPLTINRPVRIPRKRPAPDPALEPMLDELRKANEVGGAAIGFAGQESTFHRVGRELLSKADHAVLLWLAEDDHPTLRALGFAGLAALGERDALLRHVCDRERVTVCPGGCVCGGASIGSIAQEYLWSPGWLGVGVPTADSGDALLSSSERTALAFRLAAVEPCSLAPGTRADLERAGAKGWSFKAVRAATLGLPAWILVKAVARVEPEAAVPMLIEALEDVTIPARARLAAASGLTLSTSPDAEAALLRQTAFLDGQRKGLGGALREVLRMRRKADALLAKVDKVTTWMESEKLASDAIAAYAIRHPFILDRVGTGSFGARDPDVKRARGEALLWVSEHLADHADCWSAYRGVAYDLDDSKSLGDGIPAEKVASFVANVRAATARLDADASCLE